MKLTSSYNLEIAISVSFQLLKDSMRISSRAYVFNKCKFEKDSVKVIEFFTLIKLCE